MHGKRGMKDGIVASVKTALATAGAGLLLASCVAHGAGETVPPQGNFTSHDKAFFEDLLRDSVWIFGRPNVRIYGKRYSNVPHVRLFRGDGRSFECVGRWVKGGKLHWVERNPSHWFIEWGGSGAALGIDRRQRKPGFQRMFYDQETGATSSEIYSYDKTENRIWFRIRNGWVQDSLPRSLADGCPGLAAARPAGMRINEKQTAHLLDELRRQDPDAPVRNFPRSQHKAPGRTGLGASGGKPTTTKAEVEAYLEAQNGNIMVGGSKGAGYTYVRSGGREEFWRVQTANTTRMYFDVVRSEDGRMIWFGKYDYVFGYPFGYLPTGHRHPAFQLTDEFLARPYPRSLEFMGEAYADKRFVFHPEGKFSVVDEAGNLVPGPHFDGTWRWTRGELEMTVRDDPAGPRSIEWWELASDLDLQPKIWSRLTPNTG